MAAVLCGCIVSKRTNRNNKIIILLLVYYFHKSEIRIEIIIVI